MNLCIGIPGGAANLKGFFSRHFNFTTTLQNMVEMHLYNHQLKREAIKAIKLNKFKEYVGVTSECAPLKNARQNLQTQCKVLLATK